MKKKRNVINLTAWVLPDKMARWNEQRVLESFNPDHPIGWSEWIQTKVETALNISQLQGSSSDTSSHQLEAQVQNLKIENQRLRQRVVELENREMDVSSELHTQISWIYLLEVPYMNLIAWHTLKTRSGRILHKQLPDISLFGAIS